MGLISLKEYAELHSKALVSVRQKAARGGFQTAKKIGRNWVIDKNEPYSDNRETTGEFKDWRNKSGDKNA